MMTTNKPKDIAAAQPATTRTDKDTALRLPLPHDRDEAADQQGHPIEPVIEQAQKDVSSGQRDTDLRGTAAENFDRKFGPRNKHGAP